MKKMHNCHDFTTARRKKMRGYLTAPSHIY